jgi:hypothetical protein
MAVSLRLDLFLALKLGKHGHNNRAQLRQMGCDG